MDYRSASTLTQVRTDAMRREDAGRARMVGLLFYGLACASGGGFLSWLAL